MTRLSTSLVFAVGLIAGPLAIAAEDPIANRQGIMKNNSAAMDVLSKMTEGELEFEATAAALALRTVNSGALGLGDLFPEGSETGGETRAAPKIWDDMAGFQSAVAKFQSDTSAAVAAPPATKEELVTTVEMVSANCGACHEPFRLPRQ